MKQAHTRKAFALNSVHFFAYIHLPMAYCHKIPQGEGGHGTNHTILQIIVHSGENYSSELITLFVLLYLVPVSYTSITKAPAITPSTSLTGLAWPSLHTTSFPSISDQPLSQSWPFPLDLPAPPHVSAMIFSVFLVSISSYT